MSFVHAKKREEERWKVTDKNNNVTEKDRRCVVRNIAVQNTLYKFFSTTKIFPQQQKKSCEEKLKPYI